MNERIFHLSGTESIEELRELLTWCTCRTVVFLFPQKSWIFQQNTDLQSLRDLADDQQKEIILVTQNALARTDIQSMGISVFASLEDREKTPFEQMKLAKDSDFSCKKISTIPLETLRNALQKKAVSCDTEKTEHLKNKISRPVLHSLILLGVFLFLFFLFVLHIAIPDAVINISPFKKEEEMHINVHMLSKSEFEESDLWRENNGIFAYPIEQVYEISKTFSHVSQEFQGKNATGKMKITNTLAEDFVFRGGTRMKNKEGIVFVTKSWVKIPAAKNGVSGVTVIDVVASEKDIYQKLQGERANMPKGQKFIFPGLSEKTRLDVTAENISPMTGGETKWQYKISEKDIEKAVSQLIKAARKQKKEELDFALSSLFAEEDAMAFLPLSGKQFESEILQISFEGKIYGISGENGWEKKSKKNGEPYPLSELIGQERTEFSGKIRVRVRNYAYSRESLFLLIAEKFKRSAPEGMELLSVDERVLNPEVLYVYDNNTRIKVSFSTRGVYKYVIEPKSKRGLQFSQKLKNSVLGLNAEEAKDHLINNFPEISDVDIQLWPFWVKNIPLLPEKIQLKQQKADIDTLEVE